MNQTPIDILHVDDEPDFGDMTATFLERENDRFTVETATSAKEALDTVRDDPPDCVVSDYDMPGKNGIEFLQRVREEYPELPFILFTGKGSEEVASEAISAGVTDYLQKGTGTEQYRLLAKRIENAAERYVAEMQVDWHRTVIQNMNEGVYVFDEDYSLRFVDFRVRIDEMREEEWVGRDLSFLVEEDVVSPSEAQRVREGIDRVFTGEADEARVEIEPRLPTEAETIEVCFTRLHTEMGEDLVLGTTRDITERKRRDRELKEQREFAQQALDALNDVFYVLDTDGTIESWNERATEVTGYEPAELDGMPGFELFPEDDRQTSFDATEEIIQEGETTFEADLLTKDGERVTYEWSGACLTDTDGNTTGIVGIGRDITKRKQRERELKRYEAIVENTSELITIVDEDGTLLYQSPAVERILGYDPETAVGNNVFEFVHPEDESWGKDELKEFLDNPDKEVRDVEYRALDAGGEYIWFEGSFVDMRDTVLDGVLVVARDITERKQRERELRRRSEAIESAAEGIAIHDSDERHIYANEAHAEMYGYEDPDDLLGETWQMLYDDEETERIENEVLPALDENGEWSGEATAVRSDGTEMPEELSLSRMEDGGIVCVARDTTEQKERKKELERQNDLFEKAQDIASIGAWEHDPESGDIRWTDQVYEMHGLSKEFDPSTESVMELYRPEDHQKYLNAFDRATAEGEPYDLEVRMTARDDGDRWFRTVAEPQTENGDVVQIRGIVHDITERKQRESELQRLKDRLELAIDGAELGVWDWDLQTDEVEFNDNWATMLGYDPDDIGSHLDEWEKRVHPDDIEHVEEKLDEHIAGETPQYETEHRMRTADGDWKWIRTVGQVFERDNNGNPVRAVGIHIDVDERKQRERRLEQQNERLEEFASVVSHDLRNPLTVAEGRLELAREDCDSEHLGDVEGALERMDALIEDILTLAREGSDIGEMRPVETEEILEECWGNVDSGTATLVSELEGKIKADPRRLKQVYENLLRNAVEHGGDDVTVTVGELEDRNGFYVADDGTGIPEDERKEVFEAGYSTAEDGTGFGLRIVRQIVQAHGWEIQVVESDDGGARFEVSGVETVE